ncbi:unnamed protein product [Ranitomeya imitator]|uniref:Uncharacterized protein n=1 Tax=Ranitomeya imitator TaxID=111125 RepID=A0ABN9M4J0_9NEOB|nr:unnamed protein product [Ranitomeya imitator]
MGHEGQQAQIHLQETDPQTRRMWDDPRQTPRFRGHFGESIPPLIPPGSKPRLRGRHPFHFQGGPCLPNTRFDSPGSAVMHRDMDGRWEEDTMPEEEPHLWRARSNTDYRDDDYRGEEVMDMRYREVGKPESEFRAHLAPDMDYRERAQRGPPDVDYRCEEGPTVAYRERFQPLRYIESERAWNPGGECRKS